MSLDDDADAKYGLLVKGSTIEAVKVALELAIKVDTYRPSPDC